MLGGVVGVCLLPGDCARRNRRPRRQTARVGSDHSFDDAWKRRQTSNHQRLAAQALIGASASAKSTNFAPPDNADMMIDKCRYPARRGLIGWRNKVWLRQIISHFNEGDHVLKIRLAGSTTPAFVSSLRIRPRRCFHRELGCTIASSILETKVWIAKNAVQSIPQRCSGDNRKNQAEEAQAHEKHSPVKWQFTSGAQYGRISASRWFWK